MRDLQVARTMALIYRKTLIYCREAAKDMKLTVNDVTVLVYVCNNVGVIQTEIAKALALDAAAVTRSLKYLSSEGLVLRNADPGNLRVKRIVPTEKGCQYKTTIDDRMLHWNMFILRKLSEEQKDETIELLRDIRDSLVEVDPLDVYPE